MKTNYHYSNFFSYATNFFPTKNFHNNIKSLLFNIFYFNLFIQCYLLARSKLYFNDLLYS